MKKTFTFTRIIAVALIALAMGGTQARAAYTVYADDVTSNAAVTASAAAVESNVPAAQTNLNTKSRSGSGHPQVWIDETGIRVRGPNPVDSNVPHIMLRSKDVENIVGIVAVFGMPVAIVALVFFVHLRRNKMMHETLRAMIEKGVPITPELVAELREKHPHGTEQNPTRKSGLFPGLVLTGIGTALLITGSRHSMGGWIMLFIGVAFLVTWLVERQNQSNTQPPKQ
ncbi:MAG: DUF6249 domain-containing protein [Verrucomicrobiia bacterium]|jgi:hypothetical protein